MNGTPLGADPADLAAVVGIVRGSGTSFYRGMRILPADRRYAMYAVYAFCRVVDDIADGEGPPEARRTALRAWRGTVGGLFAGRANDALGRVLVSAIAAFGLREADFLAVIDGMEMDCEAIVAPNLDTLNLYCDRVAAAVGRLSVRAFGDASPAADGAAGALGRALQLTNILRDVAEDATRGRLYLPREYLADVGVPADPAAALAHPRLAEACARLAADARKRFAEAKLAMRACDRRAMRPARLMGATYEAILARLEQRGWGTRLGEAAKLSRAEKFWIAARYAFR